MARGRLYPPSVDPGFPVLGELPTGWLKTTFGALVDVVERPVKLEPNKAYKLVNAKRSRSGIVQRSEQLGREILTKTQFETKAGDFLISRRQIIHGACGVVPAELDGAVVSNEYSTLREKAGVLLMDYLRHFSHAAYFQRTCFHSSHGVDVEKMIFKLDEWLKREVQIPPIGEQRKIAAILSSIDKAIEATQAAIEQVQVVKKAMMAELLTRGLPGRHTRFKQTEIGELPEEWSVRPLGELASIERGKFSHRPRNDPRFFGGTIPFVQTGDVAASEGRVRSYSQTLNEDGLRVSRLFPAGTIIITIAANIGDTGIAEFPVAFPDSLVGIQPGALIDNRFLELVLRTRKRSLEDAAPQNAQKNINLETLRPISIQLPTKEEQVAIAEVIESVDGRRNAERKTLESLRNLKAALSSALLSGELRVSPDESAA